MSLRKLKLPAALALLCMAFFVTFLQVEANEETDDPISPSAVWAPDTDELNEITHSCNAALPALYGQCFVDQMGSYASSEAVAFSQSLLEQTPKQVGYLTGLREAGPVDLGLVAYPGSGALTQGWALVNGAPAIISADDPGRLPHAAMEKDPLFRALRAKYPQIRLAVENDQRNPNTMPEMQSLGEGSQRFIIQYALKEPCSACKTVAYASFGFDFDAAGKFLGAKFIKVVGAASSL
jgi:hypothetical protein